MPKLQAMRDGKENLFEAQSWVELARYANVIGNDSDRAARIEGSLLFESVCSRAHWRHVMNNIEPLRPLRKEDFARLPNPEVEVSALVYARAVDSLLRISGSSEATREEIMLLFHRFQPKGAEGRARAQEEALRHRGRSRHAVAKAAGYDPSQFNKEVDSRLIRWDSLKT